MHAKRYAKIKLMQNTNTIMQICDFMTPARHADNNKKCKVWTKIYCLNVHLCNYIGKSALENYCATRMTMYCEIMPTPHLCILAYSLNECQYNA